MKVNWTAAARDQLRDIHMFVARSSPQYATKTVDRLTRRSQQIATFPRSGRIVTEANNVNIREVLEGPYRIIYHFARGRDRYHCCCAWGAAVAGRTIALRTGITPD